MSIEAMKQALEALEFFGDEWGFTNKSTLPVRQNAITDLRQAIAEAEKQVSYSGNGTAGRENMTAPTGFFFQMPEAEKHEVSQEPVAWMFQHEETGRTMCVDAQQVEWGFEKSNPRLKKIAPLYTTPPKREPLTDEECADLWDMQVIHINDKVSAKQFIRDIEAAHGIKEKNNG
jgi:hypothetical protein